jgi:dTDP-4-dehydrorhamnose 3,5-epimerase
MIFKETPLSGAYVIELNPIKDNRGFFSRAFCIKEMEDYGLQFNILQCNLSKSYKKSTLRGMHYQSGDAAEIKLFRCIEGALLDVIIDLRKGSKTFGKHFKIELTSENDLMIYVPKGFAHGFLTLKDNTKAFYMVSAFYSKEDSEVIRWDDPYYNIDWPIEKPILSDVDANYPDYKLHN